MPTPDAPGLVPAGPASGRRLTLAAKWLGIVSGVLCGLLILAIVATTIWSFNLPVTTSAGMAFGLFYFIFIPAASIPVGVLCLIGAVVSGVPLVRHPSRAARTGLGRSLGGALAVIACYASCFGIMWVLGS